MCSCSHNTSASKAHDQRVRKKPKSRGVFQSSQPTTAISHEAIATGCSCIRNTPAMPPASQSFFTARINVGLASVAAYHSTTIRQGGRGDQRAEPCRWQAKSHPRSRPPGRTFLWAAFRCWHNWRRPIGGWWEPWGVAVVGDCAHRNQRAAAVVAHYRRLRPHQGRRTTCRCRRR